VVEVGLAEAGGPAGIAPDLAQEPAEALAGEGGLGHLAPAEDGPQLVVDPPVRGDRGRGTGEAQRGEGLPEGRALGPVEVEERVIDVEENGAEAFQATTWRGR
jgi:hypothetical protein